MVMVTPISDFLIATYAPTAIPVLAAAALGMGDPYWLYADYAEMFEHRPVERWIIATLPRYFRGILANSVPTVLDLEKLSGKRSTVVRLGLPGHAYLGPPSANSTRTRTALYVGDSRPRKGLADFLEAGEIARRSISDLSLVVVTKYRCQVSSSVPYRQIIHPTDGELAELYRSSGIFVSTSWFEGLGLPPLQAMACGAPVVLTDQRGARDYAVDEQNCLVVPVKSPDSVADAIIRILKDPDLARRLSESGIETARNYRWDLALDRFEAALGIKPRGQAESVSAG
jgi:glycosyltransferase involved in cell wall biosynthesis